MERKKVKYKYDISKEENIREIMRLCPSKRSTFKEILKKIKKMSLVSSFDIENHIELNIFINELQEYMKEEYKKKSKYIIINGERFSNGDSVKVKIDEIKNKEKRTAEEKLFVREFIRYHPEITKINNDLYRYTEKHGRKKIEKIVFRNSDIFLKLEGIKKLNNFKKNNIKKAINQKISSKTIPVEGKISLPIDLTIDDKNPRGFKASLTDCNNFLINIIKEYYTTKYENPKRIVYGKFNNKTSLLVQNVYGNFVELKPLKNIFEKDESEYCQGYLILNEQGNWICSFCDNLIVKNTVENIYPIYDPEGTGLKDSSKVTRKDKLSFKKWKEKTLKKFTKELKEAKKVGEEAFKKARIQLTTWNNKKSKKKEKEYEIYKNN